jgi:iron complex outermembrane receptor protein
MMGSGCGKLAFAHLAALFNNVKAHIGFYGRNLTNDLGPATAFTVAGLFSYAAAREPRTYGVTIGAEF